jgi:hypothetical protein
VVPDAVNGQPAIRFDGGDDSLVAASSPTLAIVGDISTFFVVKFDDFDGFRAVWAKTQTIYRLPPTFISCRPLAVRGFSGGTAAESAGSSDAINPPVPGQFVIIAFDQSGTTLHHYLDGQPNGEGTITAILGDTGAPLHIGTRGDQFTRMKGDIAEIVIYDTALSEADRTTVFTYLGQRYGIATTPELTIVNNFDGTVTVSWPSTVTGWELETATALAGPWDPITFGIIDNMFIDFIGDKSFYRLRKQ